MRTLAWICAGLLIVVVVLTGAWDREAAEGLPVDGPSVSDRPANIAQVSAVPAASERVEAVEPIRVSVFEKPPPRIVPEVRTTSLGYATFQQNLAGGRYERFWQQPLLSAGGETIETAEDPLFDHERYRWAILHQRGGFDAAGFPRYVQADDWLTVAVAPRAVKEPIGEGEPRDDGWRKAARERAAAFSAIPRFELRLFRSPYEPGPTRVVDLPGAPKKGSWNTSAAVYACLRVEPELLASTFRAGDRVLLGVVVRERVHVIDRPLPVFFPRGRGR